MFRYCGEYFDKETGTLYLRARYYDPGLGRFITEDSYWSTRNNIYEESTIEIAGYGVGLLEITNSPINKQNSNNSKVDAKLNEGRKISKNAILQSSNLYLYSINNPITYIDPSGNDTYQVGLDISAQAGWRGSVSISVIKDDNGRWGIAISGGGGGGTVSVSAAGFYTRTNAESIYQLREGGVATGGSAGPGVIFGGYEKVYPLQGDWEGNTYFGGIGAEPVIEVHGEANYTRVLGIIGEGSITEKALNYVEGCKKYVIYKLTGASFE